MCDREDSYFKDNVPAQKNLPHAATSTLVFKVACSIPGANRSLRAGSALTSTCEPALIGPCDGYCGLSMSDSRSL